MSQYYIHQTVRALDSELHLRSRHKTAHYAQKDAFTETPQGARRTDRRCTCAGCYKKTVSEGRDVLAGRATSARAVASAQPRRKR
jgi:hypothetical protein